MIKYPVLTAVLMLLMMSRTSAQCPQGSIALHDQIDVDNFALNYPNCTELPGNLSIGDEDSDDAIHNLDGLENLIRINGNLSFNYNDTEMDLELLNLNYVGGYLDVVFNSSNIILNNLTTIEGGVDITFNSFESIELNNLFSVGDLPFPGSSNGLEISHNTSLENIGLNNLNSVDGNFSLAGNHALQNFVLNNLSTVGGTLRITLNDSLISVDYGNLNTAWNLWISNNEVLADLSGFSSLTSIGGRLSIYNNSALDDLTGLENLISIGGSFEISFNFGISTLNGLENLSSTGNLSISNNYNLIDLTALSNLTSLGGNRFSIFHNENLESLSGLDNISSIGDSIGIFNNPNLAICHVESICNYIAEGNHNLIEGNAPGCNSSEEVIDNCASVWESYIQGNVYFDADTDCQQSPNEPNLGNWLVKIEGEGMVHYAYTYTGGNYIQPLEIGTYTVEIIPPNALWENMCLGQTTTTLTPDNLTDIINLGANANTFCPLLEVDVTTPFVRRCFDSDYYVNYCNSGTAIAESAYIEVQLDPYFTYLNSTIPGIDLGGNLYSFDLGNIGVGECGNFRMSVHVDCDSTELGQIHCVEAHIYPDSICDPILPIWDGASIKVDAQCLGDSIEFEIENIGTEDMSDSLKYIIIEDNLIFQYANFKLNSGDYFKVYATANGAFYRLEAQQSPGHPGNSMPSAFVEGCGTNGNGEASVGFVNYYILDDGDAFVSIDCQENIGSYDPNDKQAFPRGYGAPHSITDGTDLEYMIRFQNTGTDTAFNIIIRDAISPHLNIETLRPGIASHPYRYDIEGANVAVFHFDNIMLPDSNVNEAASHGFIKFNIEQKPDNPIGTHIINEAAIYFDFNEPIITNTVYNTIGEDFMGIVTSVITPPEIAETGISVNVFPNPFDEYTRFEVEGEAVKELRLSVYDMVGREVLQQQSTHQQHITMKRNSLIPGVYVFRLMDAKQQLATGKLVIE